MSRKSDDLQDVLLRLSVVDWSTTPLGAVADWNLRLRTLVGLVLRMPSPACLLWGASGTMIFNAIWQDALGPMHSGDLGKSLEDVDDGLMVLYRHAFSDGSEEARVTFASGLLPMTWRMLADTPQATMSCVAALGDDGSPEGLLLERVVGSMPAARVSRSRLGKQNFRLNLSDALRRLEDPEDIQTVGSRMIGEFLGADRASFSEVDSVEGLARPGSEYRRDPAAPPYTKTHRLGDVGSVLRRLQNALPIVIKDTRASDGAPSDGVLTDVLKHDEAPFRAQLTVPVMRTDKFVAGMTIRFDEPHDWVADEIAIALEAGTRIWEAVERARAETFLRLGEARYRALVTAGGNVVFRMKPDWSEMRLLLGQGFLKDTSEPTSDWMSEYIEAADQAEVLATIRNARETKTMFEAEHRVKRSDGSLGWTHTRAVPLLGEDGQIVEWFGVATDVTDRHNAIEAVHRTESRLRVAEAAAGVATFDWEIGSRSFTWSPEALRRLRIQVGELGGTYKDWIATIHPDDLPYAREQIEWALEDGELDAEWRIRRPDGSIIWVLTRGIVERDRHGQPVRLYGAQLDITDRVHYEQDTKVRIADLSAQIEALRRHLDDRGT